MVVVVLGEKREGSQVTVQVGWLGFGMGRFFEIGGLNVLSNSLLTVTVCPFDGLQNGLKDSSSVSSSSVL